MNKKIGTYPDVNKNHFYGELITSIHQGGREPKPWDSFLRLLRTHTNSDVAAIVFQSPNHYAFWNCRNSLSADRIKDYEKAQAELGCSDPLLETLAKTGGVLTLNQVVPRNALKDSPHYLKLMKPFGLEHAIAASIDGDDGVSAFLGLIRGPDKTNFGDEAKDLLLELRRHFSIALKTQLLLARYEADKRIYSEVLSRVTFGTVLLNNKGRIVEINDAAQDLLKRNKCIACIDNQLVPLKGRHREELNRLVTACIAWRKNNPDDDYVEALRIECLESNDVGVVVRSAARAPSVFQSESTPSVIVHLEDFEHGHHAPEQVVARLFGLTKSEARLATTLADGFTLAGAAEKLNLTESSARTYSKKIFSKMGISRQADLVRLIVKSVAQLARKSPAA